MLLSFEKRLFQPSSDTAPPRRRRWSPETPCWWLTGYHSFRDLDECSRKAEKLSSSEPTASQPAAGEGTTKLSTAYRRQRASHVTKYHVVLILWSSSGTASLSQLWRQHETFRCRKKETMFCCREFPSLKASAEDNKDVPTCLCIY